MSRLKIALGALAALALGGCSVEIAPLTGDAQLGAKDGSSALDGAVAQDASSSRDASTGSDATAADTGSEADSGPTQDVGSNADAGAVDSSTVDLDVGQADANGPQPDVGSADIGLPADVGQPDVGTSLPDAGSAPDSGGAGEDPSTVLVVVNDALGPEAGTGGKGASVYVGDYYVAARSIPAGNVVHLTIPLGGNKTAQANEGMTFADFDQYVRAPLKSFLQTKGLTNRINVIVTTYGVPVRVGPPPGQTTTGMALDTYLASMNSGNDAPGFGFANPYYLDTPTDKPLHFRDWTNPLKWKMYLVGRLDGPSATIATGLVDKALAAEQSLTRTSGTAWFDWQHRGCPPDFGGYCSVDLSVLDAYNLAVEAGVQASLNDQTVNTAMLAPASSREYTGTALDVFAQGPNVLGIGFDFAATPSGSFEVAFQNLKTTGTGGLSPLVFTLASADGKSSWQLFVPLPAWSYKPAVLTKTAAGVYLGSASFLISAANPIADLKFTFAPGGADLYVNGELAASFDDPSGTSFQVTHADASLTNCQGQITLLEIKDGGSATLWSDDFKADSSAKYAWSTSPRQAVGTSFAWGWYGSNWKDGAYSFVEGAIGGIGTSYTANNIRTPSTSCWVPDWLNAGITATWGATSEPYTVGLAWGDQVMYRFWSGFNFIESGYSAARYLNWMTVFVGDPLYAPLAFRGNDGQPPPGAVAPTITTQPGPVTGKVGDALSFTVAATGTSPLRYQWQRGGVDIAGATATTYAFTAQPADAGQQFTCAVSNAKGRTVSSNALATITTAPVLAAQPQSQVVSVGQKATFSVPWVPNSQTYQWRRNDVDLPGATGLSYSLTAAAGDDGARFRVVATNALGVAQSDEAVLRVRSSLKVMEHPQSQTVNDGSRVSFTSYAVGAAPPTYQWQRDGSDIPGATASVYTAVVYNATDDGAKLRVAVADGTGTAYSSAATLTVTATKTKAAIVTGPSNLTVSAGNPATFTVVAVGSLPLTYQWLRNGATISGANGPTYSFTAQAADNNARFSCQVTNSLGSDTSSQATLTVK